MAAAEATNTVTNGGWLIGGKVAGLEDIQVGGIEKYVKVGEEMEELKAKKNNLIHHKQQRGRRGTDKWKNSDRGCHRVKKGTRREE